MAQRASDALTFTEEKHRIDAVRYLLQRRYPKENFGIETVLFRLGRDGRNSFRTDFAIYDEPYDNLRGKTLEKRLERVRVLAEIKRDNSAAERTKATQVRGALNQVQNLTALGVYWDDIEQRFFYRDIQNKTVRIMEAPINKIPFWGDDVGSTRLYYADLDPAKDLVRVFDEIEDSLHVYVADKMARYTIIQQLLLAKIHDENLHREERVPSPLAIQDYSIEPITDQEVVKRLNLALTKAADHYNVYLPDGKQIEPQFRCPAEALRNVTKVLSPVNILRSKTQIIQAFYMKFAKSLYKWDLAQYFTPHEVIDFMVDAVNPQQGEHVHDPACGSGDFLISAFRKIGPSSKNSIWGVDNSEQAVQISILNMVLNGDGKTSIENDDSLKKYSGKSRKFNVVLCNPPFGTRIVERRFEVLRKFDTAYRWLPAADGNGLERSDEIRSSQQAGILFCELCIKLALPGGRVGIIVPNGYLGNRGAEYVGLREWLLRNARVVAVIALPRFTFKKSGADVSASILILEKRHKPLQRAGDGLDYSFYAGNIESVGWRAGDKKAVPIYLRDPENGQPLLDENNEPKLDADFAMVADDFLRSPAAGLFGWLTTARDIPEGAQSWSVDIAAVSENSDLNLDPKRHSFKFNQIREKIRGREHIRLGDILKAVKAMRPGIKPVQTYQYVEIENVGWGEYDSEALRGWELPSRARLRAQPGDIFIAHLWSSAGKWFVAAGDTKNLLVTNGFAHFRLLDSAKEQFADLAMGLSSEAFRVQLRALCTGSDGLAEISDADILNIVIPIISDQKVRKGIEQDLVHVLAGRASFPKVVRQAIASCDDFPTPPARKSHCALV